MVINNVEALVIGQMDYKEKSKILQVFTRDLGKISVMAQGAHGPRSKYFSSTNLFNIASYDLNKGKSFYYLRDAELIESNSFITGSLDLVIAGNLVLELLTKALQDQAREEKVYDLTLNFFANLKADPAKAYPRLLAYLLKFNSFLGFQPDLRACLSCGKTKADAYYIFPDMGGFVCSACSPYKGRGQLSRSEFALLNNLLYMKSEDIKDLEIKDGIGILKLLDLILEISKENFEIKELKSEKWLEKL